MTSIEGRSRKGAWIEIKAYHHLKGQDPVAPVRERGLKLRSDMLCLFLDLVAPVRERGLK